jgi:DNA-binding beta-propeller fold protein YncE
MGTWPASRARFVVANRGSGSISVLDSQSGALINTIMLPTGDAQPEPMYVVYTPAKTRVWVGVRANDRVVAFDPRTFAVEAVVPTGAGVFHMWADPQSEQLWVVADGDRTLTVVDLHNETLLATVPVPADLVALGGKPHDVILDPVRNLAFVAVNGVQGPNDYIVQYSTATLAETGRAAVGKDVHVSLARQDNQLYAPSQGSDFVIVLNRITMEIITQIAVPGAHGAGMTNDGRAFYTTNLPGGGTPGIFAIDTDRNEVIGPATNTPYPVPQNIGLTPDSRTLFVTHSSPAADQVTIYQASQSDPLPGPGWRGHRWPEPVWHRLRAVRPLGLWSVGRRGAGLRNQFPVGTSPHACDCRRGRGPMPLPAGEPAVPTACYCRTSTTGGRLRPCVISYVPGIAGLRSQPAGLYEQVSIPKAFPP